MAADRSRYVRIFGIEVTDAASYQRYRAGMAPILRSYSGEFGYDFIIGEVLKSETFAPINRVFTLFFPDQSHSERFFADPAYMTVRREFFEGAVRSVTKIAEYEEGRAG